MVFLPSLGLVAVRLVVSRRESPLLSRHLHMLCENARVHITFPPHVWRINLKGRRFKPAESDMNALYLSRMKQQQRQESPHARYTSGFPPPWVFRERRNILIMCKRRERLQGESHLQDLKPFLLLNNSSHRNVTVRILHQKIHEKSDKIQSIFSNKCWDFMLQIEVFYLE